MCLRDPLDVKCEKLKKATQGLGTDESVLNRILGGDIITTYEQQQF